MHLDRQAKPTLTAVEMDRGDTLRFTRMDGRTVDFILRKTGAEILHTTLEAPKTSCWTRGFSSGRCTATAPRFRTASTAVQIRGRTEGTMS